MAEADDPATAWLEQVAMRPMLESLLEAVCKDKPDHLLNFAVEWLVSSYKEKAGEAAALKGGSTGLGSWAPRTDAREARRPKKAGERAAACMANANSVMRSSCQKLLVGTPKKALSNPRRAFTASVARVRHHHPLASHRERRVVRCR